MTTYEIELENLLDILCQIIEKLYNKNFPSSSLEINKEDYWIIMSQHQPWSELAGIYMAEVVLPPTTKVSISKYIIKELYKNGVRWKDGKFIVT